MPDVRVALLSQALTAATEVYKENSRISALLDDKAQKTAGVAGVFLAAAFAFLRKDSLEDLRTATGATGMVLLAAGLALFLGCIIVSGLVMWVRKIKLHPDPNKILKTCNALLADAAGPTDQQRENHVRDQIESWNRANETQDLVIADKSDKLLVAQTFLILGIIAVAVLLGLTVFSTSLPRTPPRSIQLIPAVWEGKNGTMHSMR